MPAHKKLHPSKIPVGDMKQIMAIALNVCSVERDRLPLSARSLYVLVACKSTEYFRFHPYTHDYFHAQET